MEKPVNEGISSGRIEADEDVEGHGLWNRQPVPEPSGSQRVQHQPPSGADEDDDVDGHGIKTGH